MTNSKFTKVQGGGSLILAWQVKDQRTLVIGGGYEASSRIRSSLQADAKVIVVCPKSEVSEEVQFRIDSKEVEWIDRDFVPEDLDGISMCLSTDQPPHIGAQIYDLCKQKGIPVNVADDIPKCDFWFMSNHKDHALQIAVSSNGKAPRLAKNLRKKLVTTLPKNIGLAMEKFGLVREAIQKADPGHENAPKRMKWCCDLCDKWSYDHLANIDQTIIDQLVHHYRNSTVPDYSSLVESKGTITIVGAGPGNPDLLTIAGAKALEEADLVVSDRLVSPKVLELVNGELRIAPKKLIGSSDPIQQQLNEWVLEGVTAGKRVVRLKEGDPFVFGRVGEEIEYYQKYGYQPISIPGISSAVSCAHSSLTPVTHRGVSDKLMLCTARAQGGNIPEPPPYSSGTTLVYLMAVGVCEPLKLKLIELGYPEDLPCIFIEKSTHPDERCIKTTLAQLDATQKKFDINPPSCIIIGDCVKLSAIELDDLTQQAQSLTV